MKNKSIVFMGTTDFSLKALMALQKARFNIVGIYTQPPKPSGRNYKVQKSIIHKFAEEKNIPIYFPGSLKSSDEIIRFRSLNSDLAIVSSYGLIIPQDLLDIPTYGFVNIHASLLPRWRGASPIQASILAGDEKTGVSIMKMDAGVDTGDIISMKTVDIYQETTCGQLSDQLGDLGVVMILDVLQDLENNLLQSRKQPTVGATYAKKITKDDRKINWNDSARNVLRHIKAFSPTPAAWMEIDGIYLKVLDAVIMNEDSYYQSGVVLEEMVVTCSTGALQLTEVQPAGKNKMSGSDFMRGRKKPNKQ
jgi:methionyl-tRNA formyltransferase